MTRFSTICALSGTLAALAFSANVATAGNLTVHTPPPPKPNAITFNYDKRAHNAGTTPAGQRRHHPFNKRQQVKTISW